MDAFKVSEARARFSDMLDQAEHGDDVFIERKGVRFRVQVERPAAPARDAGSPFAAVDPAVLNGQWSWTQGRRGMTFRGRRTGR